MVMMGFALPALAQEASFTITFKDNDLDKNSTLTSEQLLGEISEGNQYVASASDIDKVYAGMYGLKFSSAKANGKVTLNLSADGQVNATKIVVNAKSYGTDKAAIAVNGMSSQSLTTSFEDYTFPLSNPTTLQSITLTATKRIFLKSITVYYLEGGADLQDPGFSFSSDSYTYITGTNFDGPTFDNPNNVNVSFASTDEDVATVDAGGNVTVTGAGTTMISASSEADDTYRSGYAAYTLTVMKGGFINSPDA